MTTDKEQRKSLALVRTQTLERAQGNAVPIEFRTLSIHVTETQRSGKAGGGFFGKNAKKSKNKKEDEVASESDYFSTIDFHKLSSAELALRFNTNESLGLPQNEAQRRLQANGANSLNARKPNFVKKILGYVFGGFCSVLWVGVITFFLCWRPPLSNPPNVTNLALAILVMFVIFLQASFSAFQDFSTAKVMSSILDMIPAECTVFRDGQLVKISAANIVVGDRVHLSLGNKVPADMRIIQASHDARFDRAVLTGESEAIEASVQSTDDNFLESKNVAFMGTHIIQGSAVGLVVLKGNDTLMGRINKLTSGRKEKVSIISQEISRFVRIIICLTICLASLIVIVWAAKIRPQYPDFMPPAVLLVTLMGCVVAFIPEGMPVCVSLTLLMIARRMRTNNILPKALTTVETLGCVNVICSDKTGTLTENKMFVTNLAFLDQESTPEEAHVKIEKETRPNSLPDVVDSPHILALRQLQLATLLCNNATFEQETMNLPIAERRVIGDATDSALLRFAHQLSDTENLSSCFERTMEIPFNSRNKWMMSVYEGSKKQPSVIKTLFGDDMTSAAQSTKTEKDNQLVFVKGAPDVLLPHCTSFLTANSNMPQPLSADWISELSRIQMAWSRRGQRVLMLCKSRFNPYSASFTDSNASGSNGNHTQEELARQGLQDLCILGLVGIMDPPRPEIKDTIASCRRAGARFFMVTGDFGLTAAAIARQIGLFATNREPHTYDDIMDPKKNKEDGSSDSLEDDLGEHEVGRPRFHEGTSLVLTGSDLAKMSPGEWDLVCAYEEIVFARTSPEQKLKIVTEFQARDGVVAVTGDGVNDAPALKAADVGVAVVSGSDVAMEAADLILLGGFDSIPVAMRLGRIAFQNLQKVIGYLLPAGSWSEIWPVLINTFIGTPLPLSSFLMIIICCFTDSFPGTALVMEQEEFDLLSIPPRNAKKAHLITGRIYLQSYIFMGSLMTFFSEMFFFLYMKEYTGLGFQDLAFTYGNDKIEALLNNVGNGMDIATFNDLHVNTGQCITFVTLVILQWGNVLSIRNRRLSILQADPISKKRRNLNLFAGMFASLLMAIFVTETKWVQTVMLTRSVPIKYWLMPLPCALAILLADEMRKLMLRTYPNSIFGYLACIFPYNIITLALAMVPTSKKNHYYYKNKIRNNGDCFNSATVPSLAGDQESLPKAPILNFVSEKGTFSLVSLSLLVSQNPDDHDDDEYNDYGIQMKVDKSKDASLIHMWADEQEDNQGESFCAFIEVGLVLPETVTEFGILTIAGNQMDIEIKAVENDEEVVDGGLGANAKIITFDRVNLSSFQGTILVEALVAKKVVAKVTYGSIQILDYTAPPGVAMDLSASLELGNVYLIALFPRLLSTTFYAAAQNHTLNLVTGEGNIFGHVQKQEHHGYGDLSVKMLSGRGNVKSNIQLDDKQLLFLDSATKQGQAECFISDSFLGLFRVEGGGGDPAYGTATVEEKSDSVSKIEYSKNEIALKAGRKFTLQDNRRENPRDQSGLLLVSSGKYGSSRVTFQ
ncbi:hypothetical protein BG004_000307 [Podila humilis]|nr:hypothetical protein BG004_000307 [Podila humilis]